jgi:hypothetical protein
VALSIRSALNDPPLESLVLHTVNVPAGHNLEDGCERELRKPISHAFLRSIHIQVRDVKSGVGLEINAVSPPFGVRDGYRTPPLGQSLIVGEQKENRVGVWGAMFALLGWFFAHRTSAFSPTHCRFRHGWLTRRLVLPRNFDGIGQPVELFARHCGFILRWCSWP